MGMSGLRTATLFAYGRAMRTRTGLSLVSLGLAAACSASGPAPSPRAEPTAVGVSTAEAPAGSAAPPVASASGAIQPALCSGCEIAFVSASAVYVTGKETVWKDLDKVAENAIQRCFESTVPSEQRQPIIYKLKVLVKNPAHNGITYHQSVIGPMAYQGPGLFPAFDECVAKVIPTYSAPEDVSLVEIQMQIFAEAESMGTIGGGNSGYGRGSRR